MSERSRQPAKKKRLSRLAQLSMLRQGIKRGLDLVSIQPPDKQRRPPRYYWDAFSISGAWQKGIRG
jgi:hypothetical protein